MDEEVDPRLLFGAFMKFADIASLNVATKATLRLCCKESKAAVDATITACKIEPYALDDLCNSDWKIKELTFKPGNWAEELPPALVGHFSQLEKLKIDGLAHLEALPDNIGELQHLKEFYLRNSDAIISLPASFAELTALERVEIVNCREFKIQGLAPLKQLKQLKSINTYDTLAYKGLLAKWIAKGDFPCLKDLSVDVGYLEEFPSSIFSSFTQLTRLAMKSSARGDIELGESITDLASTLYELVLDAGDEYGRVALPEEFSKLTALRQLKITAGWATIEQLPDLTMLEKLDLRIVRHYKREPLHYIERFLGENPLLKHIRFFDSDLSPWGLPDHICGLKTESMIFDHVEGIDHLSQAMYDMPLTELKFYSCQYLEDIEAVQEMPKLKILDIRNCKHLQALPEEIGKLDALETLIVSKCNSISQLPSSMGSLCSLKRLCICLRHVTALPASVGELSSLQELQIAACHTLKTLPKSIGELKRLKSIQISSCDQLSSLPNSIWRLDAVERFDVDRCPSLKVALSIGESSKAFKVLKVDGKRV
jgi:Leucine-rich repeat (LRR) protein